MPYQVIFYSLYQSIDGISNFWSGIACFFRMFRGHPAENAGPGSAMVSVLRTHSYLVASTIPCPGDLGGIGGVNNLHTVGFWVGAAFWVGAVFFGGTCFWGAGCFWGGTCFLVEPAFLGSEKACLFSTIILFCFVCLFFGVVFLAMEKYKNKYRIPSSRLPNWDYSSPGAYFITICTENKIHNLGSIQNGKSILSPIGVIADIMWHEIKNHARNVELGAFIVMPNHVHGMLILTEANRNSDGPVGKNRFQNQGKNSVSSIIGGYKSAVTKHARRMGFTFAWQAQFWDHVVRTEGDFHRISNYIERNPTKWDLDTFNGGKGNVVLEPNAVYGMESLMI